MTTKTKMDGKTRGLCHYDSLTRTKFFHGMLDEGIYLAPSAFEAGFVSAAHTAADIDATIAAAKKVFATL